MTVYNDNNHKKLIDNQNELCKRRPHDEGEDNVIIEVPNKIISLEKSKYDRPIQTLATSSLSFNDENYQITVSNFRDLVIENERNEIIAKRKITGASSIYELKH